MQGNLTALHECASADAEMATTIAAPIGHRLTVGYGVDLIAATATGAKQARFVSPLFFKPSLSRLLVGEQIKEI